MARTQRPDVILMDMGLPGVDGWEAICRLKASPNIRSIPILALTSHAMSSDRTKALEARCDDYDTRPVEFDRLLAKLEALLG